MINPAGLTDLAIRYQRDAYLAAAEAMDLRIALARMGRRPTADERLMSRRYDAAAKAAATMCATTTTRSRPNQLSKNIRGFPAGLVAGAW